MPSSTFSAHLRVETSSVAATVDALTSHTIPTPTVEPVTSRVFPIQAAVGIHPLHRPPESFVVISLSDRVELVH